MRQGTYTENCLESICSGLKMCDCTQILKAVTFLLKWIIRCGCSLYRNFSAWISNGCFACGVATRVTFTIIAAPTFILESQQSCPLYHDRVYYLNGSKYVPSFTTINPKVLESRLKDPAVCADEYETIISVLRKYSIDCFIYIGGNHSMIRSESFPNFLTAKGSKATIVIGAPNKR